ncbi:Nitrate/TMAO reductase, membrane-bound tetraheme cytochrome c subunit (plasmid) [Sinorhizobium meliloti GR4]|nr:Nitrate/TMAO reductase, membrane-bound tetraheme cytochrome c subunit [Sinorhizobium meliloti GR4]
MARIKRLLLWVWKILTTPAATLSLAFLTLGGFVGGVIFWGAFNTALELTNTEEFCVSCHEMRANVYEELKRTVHFSNRSGVRASCPDCHVPHEWTDKIARKMQASKEVWGKLFGTINTREKFLDHRLELAKHEWARLKANDSLECATVTPRRRWTFPSRRNVLPRSIPAICCRERRPASTAIRALPTNCPTCSRGGSCRPNSKERRCLLLRQSTT